LDRPANADDYSRQLVLQRFATELDIYEHELEDLLMRLAGAVTVKREETGVTIKTVETPKQEAALMNMYKWADQTYFDAHLQFSIRARLRRDAGDFPNWREIKVQIRKWEKLA